MLQAYFDESKSDNLVSVSGFVGREDQWQAVGDQWRAAFRLVGIPYLHMAEFVSDRSPVYQHLTMSERLTIVRHLATILRRNIAISADVTLDAKSFEAGTSTRFRSQIGTAYTICAASAVMMIGDQLREDSIDWNVTWTFEHGHANSAQLASRLTVLNEAAGHEFRIQGFGFSSPAPGVIPEIPLQAADMLAYASIQPDDCLDAFSEIHADEPSRIMYNFSLPLSTRLVRKIWGPIAELEAHHRKVMKLAVKGLSIADGLGSRTHVYEDELPAMQRSIDKLNKVARLLKIEQRARIVTEDKVIE
ncbi:MAG: hypothetical protein ABI824_02530 [Acidobacteriota bacterium]